MPGQEFGPRKPYLSIVEGTVKQKVDKSVKGAKLREYELSDGTKGSKWELTFKSWSGVVQDIRISTSGDYGDSLEIEFEDAILSLNAESRYFGEAAKKLKAAKVGIPIIIAPYDFEADGKQRKGVTIYQETVKVDSYYWDPIEKKSCNGIPDPEKTYDKMSKDDWKMYFLLLKKFLIEELIALKAEINAKVQKTEMEGSVEIDLNPVEEIADEEETLEETLAKSVEEDKNNGEVAPEDVPILAKESAEKDDDINIEDIPF